LAHVAVAVPDADEAAAAFAHALGAVRGEEEVLDDGTLRVVFLHLGSLVVELLEPRPGHTVSHFLEKRGAGLHHICLDVPDVEATLARCKGAGIEAIDPRPRPGAHGARVAFLHPKSLAGVLVELRQPGGVARTQPPP
jgi:methylmalonyl-CoA/ethylmalonyl-CoA epimerase